MDPCNPKSNIDLIRTRLKANFGIESNNISQSEICDIYSTCTKKNLPLPPMRKYKNLLIDRNSPLTPKEYEILFKNSNKKDLLKVAKKVGVVLLNNPKEIIKAQIIEILKSKKILEPIRLSTTVTKKLVNSNSNSLNFNFNSNTNRNRNSVSTNTNGNSVSTNTNRNSVSTNVNYRTNGNSRIRNISLNKSNGNIRIGLLANNNNNLNKLNLISKRKINRGSTPSSLSNLRRPPARPTFSTNSRTPRRPSARPTFSTNSRPSRRPRVSRPGAYSSGSVFVKPAASEPSVGGGSNKPSASGASNKPSASGASNKPSASGGPNKPSASGGPNKPSASGGPNKPSNSAPSVGGGGPSNAGSPSGSSGSKPVKPILKPVKKKVTFNNNNYSPSSEENNNNKDPNFSPTEERRRARALRRKKKVKSDVSTDKSQNNGSSVNLSNNGNSTKSRSFDVSSLTNNNAYDILGLARGSTVPSRSDLDRFRKSAKSISNADLVLREKAYSKLMGSSYIPIDCKSLFGPSVNYSNRNSIESRYQQLMLTGKLKSKKDTDTVLGCSEMLQKKLANEFVKKSGIKINNNNGSEGSTAGS